jgi:hypothetical protein
MPSRVQTCSSCFFGERSDQQLLGECSDHLYSSDGEAELMVKALPSRWRLVNGLQRVVSRAMILSGDSTAIAAMLLQVMPASRARIVCHMGTWRCREECHNNDTPFRPKSFMSAHTLCLVPDVKSISPDDGLTRHKFTV